MAKEYDINIHQGSDFGPRQLTYRQKHSGKPIDLTGYTARCQVRSHAKGRLLITMSIEIVDPPNGKLLWSASDSVTETLDRNGVYQIKLDGPREIVVMEGAVHLIREVTV